MNDLFQRAPSPTQRLLLLNHAAQTLLQGELTPGPLSPLLSIPPQPRWQLSSAGRTVTVDVPVRGEDGAYLISIDGEPLPLLQRGVDRFSQQYRFHRTTEPDQPVAFTIEWQGGDGAQDALQAVYFLQLLMRLLQTLPAT